MFIIFQSNYKLTFFSLFLSTHQLRLHGCIAVDWRLLCWFAQTLHPKFLKVVWSRRNEMLVQTQLLIVISKDQQERGRVFRSTHQTCLSKVICFSVNFGIAILLMTDRGRWKSPHHACQSAVYEIVSNFDQVIRASLEKLPGVEFLDSWSPPMFCLSWNEGDVFITITFPPFSLSTIVFFFICCLF